MFYEDVVLKEGDTVDTLAVAYGHNGWPAVWNDRHNASLVARRGRPEQLQAGDTLMVPIPWRVTTKTLVPEFNGAGLTLERDGGPGSRVVWAQTVYPHNQPAPGVFLFCVDACTPDDDLPFYWTEDDLKNDRFRRKRFSDRPYRDPPSTALGTTRWRAIVSMAVVTGQRVTVFGLLVWGFDLTPSGDVTTVGPRAATALEGLAHLGVLHLGKGTGPFPFALGGWTFRLPPVAPTK